jgi:4-amino-4-deoxy-L-arabinose transferase-like glycosyltransferase
MTSAERNDRSQLEWLAVAVVTLIGAGLRLWPIGRLGLTHFDEGIYALVASWVLQPKGLSAIDPVLISYAPPGYPILGGLAYAVLGRSDGAMIAVSQLAGTLTIPVVAWLGRRTFGAGAGFASAAFCAFNGTHLAFSRMALTDVSFLLTWLLALGAGMRFLERPGLVRAVVMGSAVGLAQQFKYNGWLTGGMVIGSAFLGIWLRPEERKVGPILKTFGWGGLAAGVAWLVVWPWYAFVESHGGYSALLRHQQSYLGGFGDWWPNLLTQIDQARALSGGPWLTLAGVTAAGFGLVAIGPPAWSPIAPALTRLGRPFGAVMCIVSGFFFVDSPHKLGVLMAPWLLCRASPSERLVGIWWISLALTSPFYHPYARLWLPFHAANWMLLGWLALIAVGACLTSRLPETKPPRFSGLLRFAETRAGASLLSIAVILFALLGWRITNQTGLLFPSDSLYQATLRISASLPDEVKALRLLVRPPVTFYLVGRVGLYPMAASDQLEKGGDPASWALVDAAILRSELGEPSGGSSHNLLDRFSKNWEVVEEFPTTLPLPTLLDLDPGVARRENADRSCPLWLLRPRRPRPSQ